MDNSSAESSPSQDFLSWRQSIVDYVKIAQARCLDFRRFRYFGDQTALKDSDAQPIFDSLVGSQINEIYLYRNLMNEVKLLSRILSKTKVERLHLSSCRLTVDDFMSLITVLRDTRITELVIEYIDCWLEKRQQVEKLMTLIAHSHLNSLKIVYWDFLPAKKSLDYLSVFLQRLADTKITCLHLEGCYSLRRYFHKNLTKHLCTWASKLKYTHITNLNLTHNYIGNSLAKAIGAVLGKSKLEKLNLSHNNLTDSGVDYLVPGLVSSKITHLNLSHNYIKGDNRLGLCLKNTKIIDLDLSSNPIRNTRIFSGCNFVRNSEVSTLKLSSCFMASKLNPLPMKKLKFSELTVLNLSENELSLEQVSALADILCNSNLTQISLSSENFSKECFNALGKCLNRSKLKYVDLHDDGWRDEIVPRDISYVRSIASFVERTKGSTIKSLALPYHDFRVGSNTFASALTNTTFLALNLEGNLLGGVIASLATQLKLTSIVELNLPCNGIGDEDAAILARSLEETQIVRLYLYYNSITSRGADALALALKRTRLRQLDLRFNKIEDDGLESLAEHAKNTCVTYLNVYGNLGKKRLLIEHVLRKNRKKMKKFADLLKQTDLFTGDSVPFEFDRDFDAIDLDVFVENCLNLYRLVAKEPFVVNCIEQDKCISGLKNLKRFDSDSFQDSDNSFSYNCDVNIFIEDCTLIHKKVLEQSTPQTLTEQDKSVLFFNSQFLGLILDEFPRKFVSFIGRATEADVEQHVSLLRKVEELGLTSIVELLLLNRPLYVIDEYQGILHPFVYILLSKYKQPVCNSGIEPNGVSKIIKYFTNNILLDGAPEVVSLLSGGILT